VSHNFSNRHYKYILVFAWLDWENLTMRSFARCHFDSNTILCLRVLQDMRSIWGKSISTFVQFCQWHANNCNTCIVRTSWLSNHRDIGKSVFIPSNIIVVRLACCRMLYVIWFNSSTSVRVAIINILYDYPSYWKNFTTSHRRSCKMITDMKFDKLIKDLTYTYSH